MICSKVSKEGPFAHWAFRNFLKGFNHAMLRLRSVIAASITIVVLKQLALIALILQVYPAQEKLRSLMRRSILNFSAERR